MFDVVGHIWIVPLLPLVAAGIVAVTPRRGRRLSAGLAIGSLALAFVFSLAAFVQLLGLSHGEGDVVRVVSRFRWLDLGGVVIELGWVCDPLAVAMLLMVTFVGLLIFIYSVGYMAEDEQFTRFFGFLSLFAAAMLGMVIANSLLLFFACWELVGLASYLLIGFWFTRPSAAAAAKKAFITTRIGDLGLFLGMLWLSAETGTLLFYAEGQGCLESSALATLTQSTCAGLTVATCVGLLLFWGAVGKSGQLPLHVWLPDAMEGPTPVSALIHAATMVAAGVFLLARMYPLMDADPAGVVGASPALTVVAFVGAITAVVAAAIAVAQFDIKRILAYSTVSQLGYMMMGLGVGGVPVAMLHLLIHACFKALLFLGAGSVLHGAHHEQDIRRLGGLRPLLPVTFATYAVGMMALAGVPLVFSGFWSKDGILHAAHLWKVSQWPFLLGLVGALLTAFYMTRQVVYVFLGRFRGSTHDHRPARTHAAKSIHESPKVMTIPLVILAAFTVGLSVIATPAWPWLEDFLVGHHPSFSLAGLLEPGFLHLLLLSTLVVVIGLVAGWSLYGKHAGELHREDPLAKRLPRLFRALERKLLFDELYEWTVVRAQKGLADACHLLDEWIGQGVVYGITMFGLACGWCGRLFDEFVVNLGFDRLCERLRRGGGALSAAQDGQVHTYLRVIGLGVGVLLLLMTWGCGAS